MELKQVDVNSLIAYPENARTHNDKQVAQIAESIKEFGFCAPCLVDEKGVLIAGHGRVMAAQTLGLKTIPTISIEHLTPEQVKAYRLADNQLALNAGWDFDLLGLELGELNEGGFNLDLLGFDPKELETLLERSEGLTDPDEVPEEPETPVTKAGDLWLLGNHRLLCGDSTSIDAVNVLMAGQKADMVFTDPPYNVSIATIKHRKFKQRPILNDSMSKAEFREFCIAFASNIKKVTDGIIYCWSGQGADGRIMFTVLDECFHNSTTIMWYKDKFTPGRGKYQNQYEPCWFGWSKNGNSFIDDRKLVNVWKVDRPKKSDLHPTMKPVELVELAVTHSSKQKDIVLDIFAGSGSTLIGCEKAKRLCFSIEMDPIYVDVAVTRWQNFTGKDATLETGETFKERSIAQAN
jgi:DNA modification methylase